MSLKHSPRCWFLAGTAAVLAIVTISWFATHPRQSSTPSASVAMERNGTDTISPPPSSPGVAAAAENPSRRDGFEKFRTWCTEYAQVSDPTAKARLETEGEALAQARREMMARLIEEDPERALKEAMPFEQRQQLPPAIASQLEQVVSGRGAFNVLGVLPEEGAENQAPGVQRTVQLGEKTYNAFVYGRRLAQVSSANVTLHGIAVGNALAVHESPVRVLDAAEATARAGEVAPENAKCPVSGTQLTVQDAAAVVDVAGQVRILCSGGHIQVLEGQLAAAEGTGTTGEPMAAPLDSWSQGPKTMLYIRVRFSDQTSDPQTDADCQTMMNNVDAFFRENSYETTTIAATFTPVFTLSNNTAYYVSNDIYALRNDSLAMAKANGYDSVNWNLDAVRYNGGPGSFAGAAYVHARGCWLKSSSAGVACHEFGHNYGLWHANSWNPTDDSPIGPGTWQEYGDSFDTMGSANAGAYHFNPRYKSAINWIAPDGYLSASNSGTYRIYAHDYVTSSNNMRGLRVVRDANKNYWVDFRQKFTGNIWLMNGAGIRRADNANNNNPGSELLDMTPGSPDGKTDSALLIGRTFSDSGAGVHITPIGKGGTSPESLDVVVNYGTFPGNNRPTLALSASSTAVAVNATVTLTATASDADGDALAYSWDFDNKTYGYNTATVTKSWSTVGEYVVRCVVSDMKGGSAIRWIVITVGSPTTYRISGRVLDSNGNPMQGARVHNGLTSSSYRGCFADVDGYYTIANLAASSYTVGAAYYGSILNPSGFSNPVAVGPSKTGIDFVGAIKTYTISGKITDGGVAVAGVLVSDGFRQATSNSNGDYVINNVPNGSYSLSATKSGYSFIPSGWSNPITVADANVTANFITPTYTVSGEITGVAAGTVLTVTDGYRSTTTYKQGNGTQAKTVYNLTGVPAGSWNLRAILAGSSFSPNFINPLNVTGNTSSKNFALDATPTCSIAGTVNHNGSGLPGATVTAGSRSSLSDSRGGYYINGVANGSYTVVPTLSSYSFTPASINVTINSADLAGQNFTASQVTVPTVTLTTSDGDASEPGSNTGRFTVTRNGSTASALTVLYSVSGTATAGSDYAALSGSVTIPSGASRADVTVTPLDDTAPECAETVVATLTANASYIIGSPASGTVTINDDDLPTITITATDASAAEVGGDTGTVRITRNGCLNGALTVNYNASGAAAAGIDYQALSGSVTIPAGANSATITITPIDDALPEGDEAVIVGLAANASYVVGSPSSASVLIADNDTNHAPTPNAGPDQAVSILGLANLNGSATDDGLPAGSSLSYSWAKLSGPGTVVADDPGAKITTASFSATGAYTLRLTVSDGELSATDDVIITVVAADPAKVLNTVNAGGPQITSGITYLADGWFTGGNAGSSSSPIAATADQALYQTDRSGAFSYDIPVSGGTQNYLLGLKFAETDATAAGQRIFDVLVNGTVVTDDLDIFAQAGANTALDLVIPITVDTAVLNIQFQTAAGSTLPAKVNAIVVGAAQVLPPAAPANLTATASGIQIDLDWTDQSANETSFQIEVSTDGTTFSPLASVPANVTGYTHTGLSPATTYYYRVRACNSAGCSAPVSASDTTEAGAPLAPSNLSLVAVSANQINLSWADNSSNEDGFVIERSTTGKSYTAIATVGPNVTAFASTGLAKGTRYYYRVRAFNALGYSAYSNTANTRTKSK